MSNPTVPITSNSDDAALHRQIEQTIFLLLDARQAGATICPSEVARALRPDGGAWRQLMPHIRQVAHDLTGNDRLRVTRGGVVVDALGGGGPIRLG